MHKENNNMKYFKSRNYKDTQSAGNKAKTDIETIMMQIGIKNAGLHQTKHKNKIEDLFFNFASAIKTIFTIKHSDILVLQYPLKKYYSIICKCVHFRGGKIITIIHDLGSFRRKRLTPEKEIKRLSNSDYVITHNKTMSEWLINNGLKTKLGELIFFDFISDSVAKNETDTDHPANKYRVIYAGALSKRKNEFLYKISNYLHNYSICLYGKGFPENEITENIELKGFVQADTLIAQAEGDFGLVWDGNSLDGCEGDWGEYLKINQPHKASLYIRCSLPLIVWNQSANAEYVKSNKIGICIDSLKELDTILPNISKEEYVIMLNNVREMSHKLATGKFIEAALEKAFKAI